MDSKYEELIDAAVDAFRVHMLPSTVVAEVKAMARLGDALSKVAPEQISMIEESARAIEDVRSKDQNCT